MMKVKHFFDAVYKLPIILVRFDNEKELKKLRIKALEDEKDIWGMTLDVRGKTRYSEGKAIYILLNTGIFSDPIMKLKVGIHESFHATSMILHNAGVEHTSDTEEAYAYHVEWLTSEVLMCMAKMGNKEKVEKIKNLPDLTKFRKSIKNKGKALSKVVIADRRTK